VELTLTGPTLAGAALTLIHVGRAPTRSELTRQLGVTRATVGAVTGELRDLGLIEVDAGAGGGHQGRPSHRLLPAPGGPVALAAQVHPDGYAVALVGLGGAVVAHQAVHGQVDADPGRAFDPVAQAGAALLAAFGRRCVGAAVAVPTAVTSPGGTTVRALYVGWPDGAPVRDAFAASLARHRVRGLFGCEAVNDVNALALAEHRHGAGRDATHLLVVSAEHRGVGGALVQHGALYAGSGGLAMEAGHVSVDPAGRPCLCGNRGCLNVEADAERFLEAAGHQVTSGGLAGGDTAAGSAVAGGSLLETAVAVLRGGYQDDPRVRAAADDVAERLGLALAGLINVVSPDRVLLGGLYAELLRVAPGRLRAAVASHSPWRYGAAVPVEAVALPDGGLIGAAEVAWQPVLDSPALLRG
jgi:predicted NBD/HSP70 family sugar kinase